MAETASTTTRPSRARKATGAVAKPAATSAKPAVAAPKAEVTEVTRFKVELVNLGDTKSYVKFGAPDNLKGTFVGQVYAPIGTERVVVMVVGAGDDGSE
mgnify:CR=1 FL=1